MTSACRSAFDEAVRRLNTGHTVGIFPEGALSPFEDGVSRAHIGVARLALTAPVPVIPVGIALHVVDLSDQSAARLPITPAARAVAIAR